jgi:hypothetical protein
MTLGQDDRQPLLGAGLVVGASAAGGPWLLDAGLFRWPPSAPAAAP